MGKTKEPGKLAKAACAGPIRWAGRPSASASMPWSLFCVGELQSFPPSVPQRQREGPDDHPVKRCKSGNRKGNLEATGSNLQQLQRTWSSAGNPKLSNTPGAWHGLTFLCFSSQRPQVLSDKGATVCPGGGNCRY